MEYQDSELTQALREKNYYKSKKREVMFERIAVTICVLAILFFLGRTLVTYYQAF